MATPWDNLLVRSATRAPELDDTRHQQLAHHPNPDVRQAWANRSDIPESLAVRRSLAETDHHVLRALADNPAVPSSAIALMAEHHPDHIAALRAAFSAGCPDDVAARVFAGRLRVRVKHEFQHALDVVDAPGIGIDDPSKLFTPVRGRPATAAVLASLLPSRWLIPLAHGAAGDVKVAAAAGPVVLRRALGADVRFNAVAVAALCILGTTPTRRSRNIAERRGGPLRAWVNLHDGTGTDVFDRFDFTTVARWAERETAGLLITRARAEGVNTVVSEAGANPHLDNTLVAHHIAGIPSAKEVIMQRDVPWDASFVEVLAVPLHAALESDSGLIRTHVTDDTTLQAIARTARAPRVQRLVAMHPLCSISTALLLPAGVVLESYHNPGLLHAWVASRIGSASDAASTLSVEFLGTLGELIDVARGLVRD